MSESMNERAARWVKEHPVPLCQGFIPKPEPAEFWCGHCGWNEPMHGDEEAERAITKILEGLA